jgi:hypothetical protein
MSVADNQWPAVGATGARFGTAARRHRTYIPRHAAAALAEPGADVPVIDDDARASGTVEGHPVDAVGAMQPSMSEKFVGDRKMDQEAPSFVRPFVRSQGRTRAEVELPLEALVSTSAVVASSENTGSIPALEEHRVVLGLCAQPRSIMEVAALAGIPLGVARVLVGDLAASGELTVHRTVDRIGPGAELLRRVLSGLNQL